MAGTKNLGQVAGLFIGTTPPENTSLIWYDSTPSMQCHKVYSVTLGQWVVLDDNTILAVEYSVLRNRAQDPGLSVGQWFKITDKDNALALAITSTKVQYVDSIGNILIDDLSASIQYHVTHQNLLIDDVHGVFDTVNKRLVFEFSEVSAVNFLGDDFVLAERKVNNVWSLFKIRFSNLLSTTSGNTITWDNGFYLNFTQRFMNMLDVTGGAVSKATFDSTVASIRTDLTNVANNQQASADQAAAAIAAAVTDDMIFNKRLPSEPDTITGPADIIEGDTLQMIVNKVQRWFNSLKWATGIGLSDDYAEATDNFNVNNNDSVETAISKLAGHVRALQQGSDNGTDNVIVSPGYNDAPTSDNGSGVGSPLTRLLEKLRYYSIKHETTDGITLDGSFSEQAHTLTPGSTNLTDVLEQLAFKISRNIQPIHSLIAYHETPNYDNVLRDAGFGWFPCGFFFVGDSSAVQAEQTKWNNAYNGKASISFATETITATGNVALRISAVSPNGGTSQEVPNITGRVFRGFDPRDGGKRIGVTDGSDNVTIDAEHLPSHEHTVNWIDGESGSHTHGGATGSITAVTSVSGTKGKSNDAAGVSGPEPIYSLSVDKSSFSPSISANGSTHTHNIRVTGGATAHQSLNVTNPMILTSFIIRLL